MHSPKLCRLNSLTSETILAQLAGAIYTATQELHNTTEHDESQLPTAASLARQFGLRLETVKKKLQQLRQAGFIQVVGVSPKHYWFDVYALKAYAQQVEPDDPLYTVFFADEPLCSFLI